MAFASRGSVGRLGALVAAEVVWIATRGRWAGPAAWVPLVVVVVLHAALVAQVRRGRALPGAAVVAAVALVAVTAVAVAPYGSLDLYQYAFYGRMAAHHGADPSVTAPDAFPGDPLYAALAPGWHHARSVYGPVFTWFSMLGSAVFGTSVVAARLWFQGAAALALVGSAARLRREVGVDAALAVGLSPVLVATVNGGHNDLVVGWLVLVALSPRWRDRPIWCGVWLGLALGTKLSALPMVLGIAAVAVQRRAWRPLATAGAAAGAVVVGAYALGGGWHLLAPLRAVGSRTSRASAWGLVERMAAGHALGGAVLAVAGAAALVVVGVTAWRWRRSSLGAAATAAGAVACFAAPYVLAWYPASVLPVSGLAIRSRAASALQIGGSVLLLAYVVPAGQPAAAVPLAPAAAVVSGAVLALLVVALVWGADTERGAGHGRRGQGRRNDRPARISFRFRTRSRV